MQGKNKQSSSLPKKFKLSVHEPESNRIFSTHKRGISSLSVSMSPPKPKFYSREHNIMLLKRTIKRNSRRSQYELAFTKKNFNKSMEDVSNPNNASQGSDGIDGEGSSQNNKVNLNVINIMNCSTTTPKLKSNYCKKITLTNVQKYYQLCLKKVQSITDSTHSYLLRNRPTQTTIINVTNFTTNPPNSSPPATTNSKINAIQEQNSPQIIQEKNLTSRPTTPLKRQKSRQSTQGGKEAAKVVSFNNCPNTFNRSINLIHSKKQLQNLFQLQCCNIAKLMQKKSTDNKCQPCQPKECKTSNRLHLKQQLPRRGSKSSHYNRNNKEASTSQDSANGVNSRYGEGKKQFVIDGWEAHDVGDNIGDDGF